MSDSIPRRRSQQLSNPLQRGQENPRSTGRKVGEVSNLISNISTSSSPPSLGAVATCAYGSRIESGYGRTRNSIFSVYLVLRLSRLLVCSSDDVSLSPLGSVKSNLKNKKILNIQDACDYTQAHKSHTLSFERELRKAT